MHITGPDVVKTVTHEEVTSEELGGATAVHNSSVRAWRTSPRPTTRLPGRGCGELFSVTCR